MTNFQKASTDYLFLREGTTYTKIPFDQIFYIEADGNYAYLFTSEKRFAIKRSLASIGEQLPSKIFIRVSRGIILNWNRVESISFADATIRISERELKIGKAYFTDIRERMPRL